MSICFGTYDATLRAQTQGIHPPCAMNVILAGIVAGFVTGAVVSPGERLKCLLQVNNSASLVGTLRTLWKTGGVRNLYKGTIVTIGREMTGTSTFFLTNWMLRDRVFDANPSAAAIAFAGGCVMQWTAQIPLDTIKSRMQTQEPLVSIGYRTVVRDIYYGVGQGRPSYVNFFNGLTPALLRAFPASAALFLGVEGTMAVLKLES